MLNYSDWFGHTFIISFVSTFSPTCLQIVRCNSVHTLCWCFMYPSLPRAGHVTVNYPVVFVTLLGDSTFIVTCTFRTSVAHTVLSAWHYAANIMLSNNAGCICKMWTYYFLFTNTSCLSTKKWEVHTCKSGSFNYYILIHSLTIRFSNTLPNTVCINYQKISLFIKFFVFFYLSELQ